MEILRKEELLNYEGGSFIGILTHVLISVISIANFCKLVKGRR